MPKANKPYDEDEDEEDVSLTGPCKDCQYYDVDRGEDEVSDASLASCLHPDLEEFDLTVSGDSSCNLFEPCDAYEDDDEDEDDDDEEDEEEEF